MPRSQRGSAPLSLWKRIEPSDVLSDEIRASLLAELKAAAQASERPEVREAATLGESGNLDAMIALALDYAAREPLDERDFEFSIGWLLLAAPSFATARFAIGWFLARRAGALRRQVFRDYADERTRPLIGLLERRSRKWLSDSIAEYHILENLVGPLPTLATVQRNRDDAPRTRRYDVTRSLFQPGAGAHAASPSATVQTDRQIGTDKHVIRVLDPIAPAHGDLRLEAIIEQFTKLTGPVPTTPLPAVDQLSGPLRGEFPWADRVIDWVEANLRLANHVGAPYFALAPMLLTGPPGCGKTRFVRRLAELAGTGFGMVGAAGSNHNRTLSGTARGWSNTCPALPLLLIEAHFRANPIILVDEVDKTGMLSSAGRIIDSLLLLLEPETAARWFDECLLTRANLSAVTWICTANQASGLPAPLRSRLTVLPFGIPRDEDFPSIIPAIRRDLAREYRCDALALPELSQPVVEELRAAFRHHRDLRVLRRLMVAAMASATRDKPVTH